MALQVLWLNLVCLVWIILCAMLHDEEWGQFQTFRGFRYKNT